MRKLMLLLLIVCNPALASKSTFQVSFTVLAAMSIKMVPEKDGLSISTLGSPGAVYRMSIANGHEKSPIKGDKSTIFYEKSDGNEKSIKIIPNSEKDIYVTIEF